MPSLFLNETCLIPDLQVADTFAARALGLMGHKGMPHGHGLLIQPCRSIHTWFMRFPLDVIFLDKNWRVVKVGPNLKPWRLAWGGWNAVAVVEVRSGWLPPLQPGSTLRVEYTA